MQFLETHRVTILCWICTALKIGSYIM